MSAKLEKRIQNWLNSDPNVGTINKVCAQYYATNLPKFSWLGLLEWILKLCVSVAPPAIFHLVYGLISLGQAAVAGSALLALQLVSDWIRAIRSKRKRTRQLSSEELWIRVGDLVETISSSATLQDNKDESIVASLGIIEGFARQATTAEVGEISVSLVLYTDAQRSEMRIRHRNPGHTRPNNRTFRDLDGLLGHRACEAGIEPRSVNNILRFGRRGISSPTQSEVTYRAILIVPLQGVSGGVDDVLGFLSIDSTAPYAFFAERGDNILVTCTPIIDHIRLQL